MEENKFRAGFHEKLAYVKGDSEKREEKALRYVIVLHMWCKERRILPFPLRSAHCNRVQARRPHTS